MQLVFDIVIIPEANSNYTSTFLQMLVHVAFAVMFYLQLCYVS